MSELAPGSSPEMPNRSEDLRVLIETPEYRHVAEAFTNYVADQCPKLIAQIETAYEKNRHYHDGAHTAGVVTEIAKILEIGEKYGLLEEPVDLEKAASKLAAACHDFIHYRGTDEVEGETAEDRSTDQYVHVLNSFIDQLVPSASFSQETFNEVKELVRHEAERRGAELINITRVEFRGMTDISDAQFQAFDDLVGEAFTAEDVKEIKAHLDEAPPAGKIQVLNISSEKGLQPNAAFRMQGMVKSDIGYCGRETVEEVQRAGDAELAEIDALKNENDPDMTKRPIFPVLDNPEKFRKEPERLAFAVKSYLNWSATQPGFFFYQWVLEEKAMQESEVIQNSDHRDEVIAALRKRSPNWKPNIMSTITRYQRLRDAFQGIAVPAAFNGPDVNDNLKKVRQLREEIKVPRNEDALAA